MLRSELDLLGFFCIAATGKDRKPGILFKSCIAERKLALHERRTAV